MVDLLKRTQKLLFGGFLLGASLVFSSSIRGATSSVLRLSVEGTINPVVSGYISEGLEQAVQKNRSAVLIELDTPGGLLEATRSLIGTMINTDLPVIVYVTPRGARATSAGVFITMAADVAAMAPETHIGAAHPVNIGGEGPAMPQESKSSGNVMEEKMVSDAAAYIRSLALEKGRNAVWAEKAVRESVSLTAEEALKQNVIDTIAGSREALFKALDGKVVKKNGKTFTLQLSGAAVEFVPMSRVRKWLHMLAHPNVAYILMTLGIYALIYELASPGIGLGGAVGVICLLLAFFFLQVLPINTVAMALIILGLVLLILELLAPTHGLLTFGGLIAFALGSFFLIDVKKNPMYSRISIELIASTVGTTALFFVVILRKTLQARRLKPKTGVENLVGSTGVVQTALSPEGMVFINGELWIAEANGPMETGELVVVTKVEGNKLFVQRK